MMIKKFSYCFFCGAETLIDTDIKNPKTGKALPLDSKDTTKKHVCAASEAILYNRYDSAIREEGRENC
jgi:hypothetical protein